MLKQIGIVGAFLLASSSLADTLIVLNKGEATASLIDVKTGKTKVKLPVGNGPHEVASSPDGRFALVCNYGDAKPGNTLTLLDISKSSVAKTIELDKYLRPHGIVWWKGSKVLVTSEVAKALLIVDISTGKVEKAISTDQPASHMVALSPDRKWAYTANIQANTVTAIDLEKGVKVTDFTTGAGAEGIEVTPDGRQIWTTNTKAASVTILNANKGGKLGELPCGNMPIRVKFTKDGKTALVSAAMGHELYLYDVKTQKQLAKLDLTLEKMPVAPGAPGPMPVGILMSPDGKLAYVAMCGANRIGVFDVAKRKFTRYFETGIVPDGLAFSSQ